MRTRLRQLQPKEERLLQYAYAALALGLMLPLFFQPSSDVMKNTIHFVAGVLLGSSIVVIMISVLRVSRRHTDDGI